MPYTPLTAEQLKARMAEREARELVQMENLHEALGHLIAVKRMKLRPMNRNVLWAEWHYAKAMHDLYSDDSTETMLQDACDSLGVDAEGNDSAEAAAEWAAHLADLRRDERMIADWERGQ